MKLSPRVLVFLAAASCSPEQVTGPAGNPPVFAPTTPSPAQRSVHHLELRIDTSAVFVGVERSLDVIAYDHSGFLLDSDSARVTLSDTAVARVIPVGSRVQQFDNGTTTRHFAALIRATSAGIVTLQVALRNTVQTTSIRINPDPPLVSSPVIDSFSVAEYPVCYGSNCSWMAYSALLRLQEVNGSPVEVIYSEFTVPTVTTGLCSVWGALASGQVAEFHGWADLPNYDSSLTLFTMDSRTAPDGPATLRLIVRDDDGRYGRVEATGAIQRGGTAPSAAWTPDWSWC